MNKQYSSHCLIIHFFLVLKRIGSFSTLSICSINITGRQPDGEVSGFWSPPDCLVPPHTFISLSELLLPYMQNAMLLGPPHRVVVMKMKGISTCKALRGGPGVQ